MMTGEQKAAMGVCSTQDILDAFEAFAKDRNGVVNDHVLDRERLYARCILDGTEVRASDDRLRGGLALRVDPTLVEIRPYLFLATSEKEVTLAQTSSGSTLARDECTSTVLREALAAMASEKSFRAVLSYTRTEEDTLFDLGISMMSLLRRLRKDLDSTAILDMVDQRARMASKVSDERGRKS